MGPVEREDFEEDILIIQKRKLNNIKTENSNGGERKVK